MYLSSSLFEKYSQICSSSASWEVDCKVVDDSEGESRAAKQKPETVP